MQGQIGSILATLKFMLDMIVPSYSTMLLIAALVRGFAQWLITHNAAPKSRLLPRNQFYVPILAEQQKLPAQAAF